MEIRYLAGLPKNRIAVYRFFLLLIIIFVCLPLGCAFGRQIDTDTDFSSLLSGNEPENCPEHESPLSGKCRFEGQVRLSAWYPFRQRYDVSTTNRLDMLFEKHMSNTSIVARLRADSHDITEKDRVSADLREFYLKHNRSTDNVFFSFSAGRKILHWGKGDEIRPVDRICPEDMRSFLFYDKNERKTGITGLFIETSFKGGLGIEGFWAPVFVGSELPGQADYFTPANLKSFTDAGGRVLKSDEDWTWEKDSSLGLRISFPVYRADASVYAWRGKDPMPHLMVSGIIDRMPSSTPPYYVEIAPTPSAFSFFHSDAVLFGGDIEVAAGSWVFRTEAAWQTRGNYEQVRFEDNPRLLDHFDRGVEEKQKIELLFGIDRNDLFFRNLFVNIQYIAALIPKHENYLKSDAFDNGVSFTLKYTAFDSRVGGMWRTFAWIKSQDMQHQLELSLKPAKNILLTLGAFFYSGKTEQELFGQFKDKDFSFIQASVLF